MCLLITLCFLSFPGFRSKGCGFGSFPVHLVYPLDPVTKQPRHITLRVITRTRVYSLLGEIKIWGPTSEAFPRKADLAVARGLVVVPRRPDEVAPSHRVLIRTRALPRRHLLTVATTPLLRTGVHRKASTCLSCRSRRSASTCVSSTSG